MMATSRPTLFRGLAHRCRAVNVVLRDAVGEVEAHHVDARAQHRDQQAQGRWMQGRGLRRFW